MATKKLRRAPWTKRRALVLLERAGVKNAEQVYKELRSDWAADTLLPAELRVHIVLASAVVEWLNALAQLQLIRCVERKGLGAESFHIEAATSSTLSILVTDFGAILHLCRLGFDVQARGLLRGFIERIDLLVCIQTDAEFAEQYMNAGSFEASRSFFYKYVSGGKLTRRSKSLFKEKFPTADFIYDWLMVEWREETSLMLASAAHANHTVSILSLFPNLGRGPSNIIGLKGHPTNGSNVTITKLLYACMPLHFLFMDYPYNQAQEIFDKAGLGQAISDDCKAFNKLLLTFPLVDTWLQDPSSAASSQKHPKKVVPDAN